MVVNLKKIIILFVLIFGMSFFIYPQDGVTSASDYEEAVKLGIVSNDSVDVTDDTSIDVVGIVASVEDVKSVVVNDVTTDKKNEVSDIENAEKDTVLPEEIDGMVVIGGVDGEVDPTTDKEIIYDRGRIGNLIIFNPDEKKNILPSEDLEKSDNSFVLKTDYELDWYVPKTLTDFLLAKPEILKDMNGVVVEGRFKIKDSLGLEAYNAGYKNVTSGRISLAIEIFEKLLYYNFSVDSVEYALAICYYRIGDYNSVVKYVSRMILKTNDNDALSKANELLGEVYFMMDRFADASTSFIHGVMGKDGKRDALLLFKSGLAYYKNGYTKKASELWEKSAALGNKDALRNLNWIKK